VIGQVKGFTEATDTEMLLCGAALDGTRPSDRWRRPGNLRANYLWPSNMAYAVLGIRPRRLVPPRTLIRVSGAGVADQPEMRVEAS